ncbi:MAG: hypothetical protein AABZ80_08290 [Gemmatimonadota bacterium]
MTALSDWASSGRVKIDRANQHIRDLETAVKRWQDACPYPATLDPQDEENEYGFFYGRMYTLREREGVPVDFAAIVADAVHNLHVCLDHLWQRATTRTGHRHNQFPARMEPESLVAKPGGKKLARRNAAVELLDSLDAHKVGNPFWTIREFDDADKHETLRLIACYPGRLILQGKAAPTRRVPPPGTRVMWGVGMALAQAHFFYAGQNEGRPAPRFPLLLEDGAQVYVSGVDPNMDVDVQVAPLIAFGEGGPLEGEAVIPSLQNLSTAVDRLATAFIANGLLK